MKSLILSAASLMFIAPAMAEPISVKAGEWKTDATISMMGQAMPSQTSSECISEEEATRTPEELVAELNDGGDCTVSNLQQTPGQLTFDMSCSQEGMTFGGPVQLNHTSESVTMVGNMNMDMQGMAVVVSMDVKSDYVGTCG